MKWQSIEEFDFENDDGSAVLLSDGKDVVCGYLGENNGEDVWYYHDYPDDYNLYRYKPKFWSPLPKPPVSGLSEKAQK